MNGVDAVGVFYGLETINAHNGWAISVVGITIVFTGFVTLFALISQLHKLVALYDNPGKLKIIFAAKSESAAKAISLKKCMAPDVSGVIGSAIAAGVFWSLMI